MTNSDRETVLNNLFRGAKFWVSHHIPQRTKLKEDIQKNGGIVVLNEKYADVKLVDHLKKNLPAHSYSYQYVERSVQNGRLEDLDDYLIGPSGQRPVGASNIPTKRTRSDYTLNDDQILFDWLYPYEQEPNAPINGNKIYKQLAEKFSQHTWQSWRARYIKTLRGEPRPGGGEPRPDLLDAVPPLAARPGPSPPDPTPPASIKQESPRATRSISSIAARAVPNSSPPRAPAEDNQDQASRMPQPRPSESGGFKRKRESHPGTHKAEGVAIRTPPPKRLLVGVSDDMDSPDRSHSRSTRQDIHEIPIQKTPRRSHTQQQSISQVPSSTTKSQHEATATETRSPSSQPSTTSKSAQRAPTKSQTPSHAIPYHLLLEMPFYPSTPEPEVEETDQESDVDVNDWIDIQLERGDVELPLVLQALQCTSMNPEYAARVLEYYAAGKGIPTDMPGVWTPEDDRSLEAEDGRAVKRVYEKHGDDFVKARWEYLRLARDGGIL